MTNKGEVGVKDRGYITEGHKVMWGAEGCLVRCRGVGWSRVWGRFRFCAEEFPSSQMRRIGDV